MIFVSDSMLVFQVMVGNVNKVVEFSERSPEGLATFSCDQDDVIEAIRRHKFYRIGKIREYETRGKNQAKAANMPASTPAGEATGTEAAENSGEQVMEFSGFSQLKSYLRKTYKDDPAAKTLKTPNSVSEFAKAKGLSYRFIEA